MAEIESTAEATLARVGTALIVIGLLDVALMVYVFSSGGSSYSSGFNIFAIIGGVSIRKGNLRTAQFAGFFVRLGLLGVATAVLSTPLIYPPGLIKTFLLISPTWKLVGWAAYIALTLVLLWWLDKELQSEEVQARMRAIGLDKKWPKFVPGIKRLSIFFACLAFVLFAIFQYIEQSDTGQMAITRARADLGSDFSYHIAALHVSSTSQGRSVSATVIAYSDSEIHRTQVSWED